MRTSEKIINRLPYRPIITMADISAAIGLATTSPIIAAIEAGELSAVRISHSCYRIAREEAVRWILSKDTMEGCKK